MAGGDELPWGGTCALRGCDPRKILRPGAEIIDSARLMRGKGIEDRGPSINGADLTRHRHGFTDPVPQRMEGGPSRKGVESLHGTATFETANRLVVDGRAYGSRHFLIATGAHPRPLDFPRADHLIDSTAFLGLEQVPGRVLSFGGGSVSFEFAHIATRAGASPGIVDPGGRPLERFAPHLVDLLVERGAEGGIDVRAETTVSSVEHVGSACRVTVDTAGIEVVIEIELVGSAHRRRAATAGSALRRPAREAG